MSVLIAERLDTDSQLLRTSEIEAALGLLLESHSCALAMQRSRWEFALEEPALRECGLSKNQLRTLLCAGFIEHGIEKTGNGHGRLVQATASWRITRDSCFVLTPSGVDFAGKREQHAATPVPMPTWHDDALELRFGGQVVKCFRQPAPSQIAVLKAFERQGWPLRIDNPLPLDFDSDVTERLHDTIKRLNRYHKIRLIRFRGDGRGKGVLWEGVT